MAEGYYSESDISSLCSKGNADSSPPSLSSGNSTIDMIENIKSTIYLKKYYNQNHYSLTYQDKLDYSEDLMPYAFFLYLALISIILWMMYISCIVCKCCLCITGPATKVETRRRKLFPIIIMGFFLLGILVFAPLSIFYVNQLQSSLSYLVCVAGRWSGGYFYGYSNWQGVSNINNSTSELLKLINSTSLSLDKALNRFHDNGIRNISVEMQNFFNSFISAWNNTSPIPNPNYPSYSSELPSYYICQLCSDLNQYTQPFTSDLNVLIEPLSKNVSRDIDSIYSEFIDPVGNITKSIESQYGWIENITDLYRNYEAKNMLFIDRVNTFKEGMYSNTIALLSFTVLIMISQALAANMVYFHRTKWRKLLHLGWCCHSVLTIFFFAVAGLLFLSVIILSEGCTVFFEIISNEDLGKIFESSGRSGIQFCYYNNGDLSLFLNITSTLSFVPSLLSSINNTLSHAFTSSYQIPTITKMDSHLSSSTTSSFLSSSNTSIQWHGSDDINFFLFKVEGLPYKQNSFMNNYTIYEAGSAQQVYCQNYISQDFWSAYEDTCGDGYVYQFALSPIVSQSKDCYLISQDFSLTKVQSRYLGHNLFDNCANLGDSTFSQVIIKYWSWAETSFKLDSGFLEILAMVNANFTQMRANITGYIEKMEGYYSALKSANEEIEALNTRINFYYSTMNCSMIKDLTQQMEAGFCGEILQYLFMLSIFTGLLGFCNMCFSIGIVLFIFRFRTDLEIEKEKIIRSIGSQSEFELEKPSDQESTHRANETIIS